MLHRNAVYIRCEKNAKKLQHQYPICNSEQSCLHSESCLHQFTASNCSVWGVQGTFACLRVFLGVAIPSMVRSKDSRRAGEPAYACGMCVFACVCTEQMFTQSRRACISRKLCACVHYTYIHTYTHTFVLTWSLFITVLPKVYILHYIYTYIHTYIHTHTHTFVLTWRLFITVLPEGMLVPIAKWYTPSTSIAILRIGAYM